MTIPQTIQKAIEGGYPDKNLVDWCEAKGNDAPLLIDYRFWQSLGKGQKGWDWWHCGKHGYQDPKDATTCFAPRDAGEGICGQTLQLQWLYHWHRFIDHLAEGKSIESYFETL